MDFLGRLPDKEKSARDQYDVTPREPVAEQLEQRFRQRDDERDQRQKAKPHQQRQADSDLAGAFAHILGKLVGEDRNEDEIVDSEHDLHRDKGHERNPGGGRHEKGGETFHRRKSPSSLEREHGSEEHTSELQSLLRNSYAGFRYNTTNTTTHQNIST